MGRSEVARRVGEAAGLLLLGVLVGFVGGLFRRRKPSHYVGERLAPPAQPETAGD